MAIFTFDDLTAITKQDIKDDDMLLIYHEDGVNKIPAKSVGGDGGGFSPDITFNDVKLVINSNNIDFGANLFQSIDSGTITLNTSVEEINTKIKNGDFTVIGGRLIITDDTSSGNRYFEQLMLGSVNTGFFWDRDSGDAIMEFLRVNTLICFDDALLPEVEQLFGSLSDCVVLTTFDKDYFMFIIIDCSDTDNIEISRCIVLGNN